MLMQRIFATIIIFSAMCARSNAEPSRSLVTGNAAMDPACVHLNEVGRFAESLLACEAAANGVQKQIAIDPELWYGYYQLGRMLAYVAADLSGLGHHKQSLRVALTGHRYEIQASRFPTIGDDDRVSINAVALGLRDIEEGQQKFIAAKQGD